jgi:mannose-P-dolichol utilization defect 1
MQVFPAFMAATVASSLHDNRVAPASCAAPSRLRFSSLVCGSVTLRSRTTKTQPSEISSGTSQDGSKSLTVCRTAPAAPAAAAVSSPPVIEVLSAIVGSFVLAGSVMYKIPQVVRLFRRKSGEGVSVIMYALETLGTTFSAMYFARKAFAFSSYGELIFIMLQNVIILGLIAKYENLDRALCIFALIAYPLLIAGLASSSMPLRVLMALQVASIPILNLARIPQILLNWQRKSTGELSIITLGLQLAGNLARIFTTIASVGDPLMLTGVCASTLFNSALVGQWIFYNQKPSKQSSKAPLKSL